MLTNRLTTQENRATSIDEAIDELFRDSLINYYLDTKQFEMLTPLLSENWREFLYQEDESGAVIEFSRQEKEFALDMLFFNEGIDDDEFLHSLKEHIDNIHFVNSPNSEYQINNLDPMETLKKLKTGGDVYISIYTKYLDC